MTSHLFTDELLFDALSESDETTALDVALARTLARSDPEHGREVALAVALVSVLRRRGDSAMRVSAWAGEPFPGTSVPLPDAEAWTEALRSSLAVTTDGASVKPLVLDSAGRVQLFRDHAAEARLSEGLADLASQPAQIADPAGLAPAFAALFPDADAHDRQAVAAAGALRHRLSVVAGGPGTGKTTTVVRMLALLLAARPGLRIALAAPTGKAANRLGASVQEGAARLPAPLAEVRLPTEATTLHRLLDYSPSRRSFGRSAERPIPADVVVVDEASMIDLGLFAHLVAALRPSARLVLLGDRDQLPSVEAGAVFGDICAVAEAPGETAGGLAPFCAALGLPGVSEPPSRLGAAVVRLDKTYRYADDSGLGALARALRDGDAESVRASLDEASDVQIQEQVAESGAAAVADAVWAHVRPHAVALAGVTDAAEALRISAAFRLLAPTRGGRRGIYALNRLVETRLVREGHASPGAFVHGRPVLVTANDHDRGLYNGDVGVVWMPDRQSAPVVVFEGVDSGPLREVPVALLPEHETAWATTVHKSQGSEFERVVVVLPEAGSRQAERLTRELVYTAVTRARGASAAVSVPLSIIGTADQLAEAAARREARTSAFPDRLHAALAQSAALSG